MEALFSDRISDVPKSFIREILKVAIDEEVISFAGGLPNRQLFPVEDLKEASIKVFETAGKEALQYSNTEGYLPLREYIADYYKRLKGLDIAPSLILITSGSQQGLDLLGKTFINEGDDVIIEEPGYLGAIQSFSVFKAKFNAIPLHEYGLDTDILQQTLESKYSKLMYTVPNFQNPSGVTYSKENREKVAELIKNSFTYLIEDDPYGALRYFGEDQPSFKSLIPKHTILLGSFSKTAVPGFRLGWVVAPNQNVYEKLIIAKQASDLHTNYFTQRLMYQYLTDSDIDTHINKIKDVYGSQCKAMIESINRHFPKEGVHCTTPEGGMFLWVTLPKGVSAMDLFNKAIERKVAFVPGNPFYVNTDAEINTLRLNFSCVDEQTIEEGIKRLGEAIKEILDASRV